LPPCQGKSVSSPSAKSGPPKPLESQQLLYAMRNLSLQLEGITKEQTTIKNEWMQSLPGMPPKQLTRMHITVQAWVLAIPYMYLIPLVKPPHKHLVDSFDVWLQV